MNIHHLLTHLQILGRRRAVRAAIRYIRRRNRDERPEGTFDNARRWYPAPTEKLNTSNYRSPSRAYPFSYMAACKTVAHCARLEGVDEVALVRKIARAIDMAAKEPDTELAKKSAEARIRAILSASRCSKSHAQNMAAIFPIAVNETEPGHLKEDSGHV